MLAVLGLWAALAPCYFWGPPRISPDSAEYIDCARSVLAGQGFATRTASDLDPPLWRPMRLWPPGYPLMIALGMTAGLSGYHAAIAVSMTCMAGFLAVVAAHCVRRYPAAIAVPLAAWIAAVPTVLFVGTMCWSESAFMLAAAVSLACAVRATRSDAVDRRLLLAAGAAAGAAWSIRYAGVALAAASVIYLGTLLFLVGRARRWRVVLGTVAWGAGWLVAGGWLAATNLARFGSVQPYALPPSDRNLATNLRDAWQVLIRELSFSGDIRDVLLAQPAWAVGGAAALLAIGGIRLATRADGRRTVGQLLVRANGRRDALLLGLFATAYAAMIVAARTKYQWGETINFRHFVPVFWIFQLGLVELGLVLARGAASRRRAVLVAGILLACIAATVIHADVKRIGKFRRLAVENDQAQQNRQLVDTARRVGRIVPPGRFVLTDKPAELRVFGDVAARFVGLLPEEPGEAERQLEQLCREPIFWGLVAVRPDRFANGKYGIPLADRVASPDRFPECRVWKNE